MNYIKYFEELVNFDDWDSEEYQILPITDLYIFVKRNQIDEFIDFMRDRGMSIDKSSLNQFGNGFVYEKGEWHHVGLITNSTFIKKDPRLIRFEKVKKLY